MKDATPKDTSDPSWKNTTGIVSQEMLGGTSTEVVFCSHDAKAAEHKGEKGADIMNDKARGKN